MIAWLKRTLGASPVEPRDDLALGLAAYRSGDLQRARQILETTVHEHATSAPALKALGDVYSDSTLTAEAIHCYERALAIDPHYAEALNNLGLLRRHLADFPAAENLFRRALAAKPDLEAARINLADTIEAQGDSQGAIACLEEVLRVNPASVHARSNLGVTYASLGNWAQAEKHYRISLEHEPENARVWSNLSLALRNQARTAEALDAGLRAIECDPQDSALRSQYLLTTNYSDQLGADAICAAHRRHGGKLEVRSHW